MNRVGPVLPVAFLYNFGVSMIMTLIPLFMDDLGLSPLLLGMMVSLPAALELALRLPSGLLADRLGEKKILMGTAVSLAAAGPLYVGMNLGLTAVAQPLTGTARSAFWPTAISYVTKIPGGQMGRKMGLFHTMVSLGGALGPLLAGLSIAYLGYRGAFMAFTLISWSYLVTVWRLPSHPPRVSRERSQERLLSSVGRIARSRPVILAFLCGYAAALPLALNSSFVPVYFRQVGLGPGMIGNLISLHAVFLLVGNLIFARVFDLMPRQWAWFIGMMGISLFTVAIPLFEGAIALGACLAFLGLSKSPLVILPGVIMSESTRPEERALALAVSGMSWAVSLTINPPLLGLIAQIFSVRTAFWAAALPILVLALSVRPLFRWGYSGLSRTGS